MAEATACILHIEKDSRQHGPGSRTVVFFKGCPLQCRWCGQPELQAGGLSIACDDSRCVRCLACVAECPERAVLAVCNRPVFAPRLCGHCWGCADICPGGALRVAGEMQTLDQVKAQILPQRRAYGQSGGGVTLAGGEVLLQAEFAGELAAQLRYGGIHVAAETTGYAPAPVFDRIAAVVDRLVVNIHHYDREAHFADTGVCPDQIWQNIRAATDLGREILLQLEIWPGHNDALADAAGFAGLMQQLGARRIVLRERQPLPVAELLAYQAVFAEKNLAAFF